MVNVEKRRKILNFRSKKHDEIRPSEARIEVNVDIKVDDLINVDCLFRCRGSSFVSRISILFHPAKRLSSTCVLRITDIADVLLMIRRRDCTVCVSIITHTVISSYRITQFY